MKSEADRLAEAVDGYLGHEEDHAALRRVAVALIAYRAAPPESMIPASKVRDLAQAWTTRGKSEDAYREGYDDARNACADALDLLIHESQGGAR